jgi:hypothetical protein
MTITSDADTGAIWGTKGNTQNGRLMNSTFRPVVAGGIDDALIAEAAARESTVDLCKAVGTQVSGIVPKKLVWSVEVVPHHETTLQKLREQFEAQARLLGVRFSFQFEF